MRALAVSDLHFGTEDRAALAAAANFAREFAPDLIMVAGDVTTSGRRVEMEAAAEWLSSLPAPIVATPGNHDVPYWNLFSRIAAPWRRFDRAIGPPHAPPRERLLVRSLSTARGMQARLDWSLGRVSMGDVADIAADFATAPPATLRIVLAHHPLHPPLRDDGRARTHRGPEAAQALAQAGADLIVSGHLHVPFVEPVPAGDGLTYALGSGTLSTRTREAPPSFLTFTPADVGTLCVEVRECLGVSTQAVSQTIVRLRAPRLTAQPAR